MRSAWLIDIEAQIRRLYEAVNLREDLWATHPAPNQSQAIVVMPDRILFTLVKVPEKTKPPGATPPA
jgi:hypothetical protein